MSCDGGTHARGATLLTLALRAWSGTARAARARDSDAFDFRTAVRAPGARRNRRDFARCSRTVGERLHGCLSRGRRAARGTPRLGCCAPRGYRSRACAGYTRRKSANAASGITCSVADCIRHHTIGSASPVWCRCGLLAWAPRHVDCLIRHRSCSGDEAEISAASVRQRRFIGASNELANRIRRDRRGFGTIRAVSSRLPTLVGAGSVTTVSSWRAWIACPRAPLRARSIPRTEGESCIIRHILEMRARTANRGERGAPA